MKILNKYILLGGFPITFNNTLKTIYQPRIKEIYKSGTTISKLIRPYLLIKTNYDVLNSDGRPLLFFFDFCTKVNEQNKKLFVNIEFIQSLSLLYKVRIEIIHIIKLRDSFCLRVLNDKGEEIGLVSDDNLLELVEVVLVLFDVKIKDTTMHGDKAVIDEFERKRREYAMKKRKKEMAKHKDDNYDELEDEKSEVNFYNKMNFIIHQQAMIDYDRVFDMTVWQMQNSYNILESKLISDRYVDSGSIQYKADDFVDWINKTKFKI